jgi:hypothetical protein
VVSGCPWVACSAARNPTLETNATQVATLHGKAILPTNLEPPPGSLAVLNADLWMHPLFRGYFAAIQKAQMRYWLCSPMKRMHLSLLSAVAKFVGCHR